MDGGFNFGPPAKRPARLDASPPAGAASSFDLRYLWVALGLVVAGVLGFMLLRGAGEAGRQIAEHNSDAVAQVDRAQDVAAQTAATRAIVVARAVSAEAGAFATDPAALSAFDPSIRFTSGSSTGPASVGYASDGSGFGVAVLSESGTCWWATGDAAGGTRYGSGESCTGRAALGADAATW